VTESHHHPWPQTKPPPEPPINLEGHAIDTYRTLREGVTPYPCKVGDRIFVFDKRPSARMQLKALEVFGGRNEDDGASLEDMETIREIMGAMISDEENLDDLFDLVDLGEVAEIFNKAMEKVATRPTTASRGSSQQPPATISTTGSSAQESPPMSSTG
jgi:hypothetical protein